MDHIQRTDVFESIWDGDATLKSLRFGDVLFRSMVDSTYYSVDGRAMRWVFDSFTDAGVCYRPEEWDGRRVEWMRSNETLAVCPADARFNVYSVQKELAMDIKIPAVEIGGKAMPRRVGISLTVPERAVIHLAEYLHTGHRLDRDMAYEHWYECNLRYNMMVIELDGLFIRLRTEDENLAAASARVWRHPETFTVSFCWPENSRALLGVFCSLEEAVADFIDWARVNKNLRTLKSRDDVPAWLYGVRVVITLDMLNSDWQVCHDFADVGNLAREMAGCIHPDKVLFYLVGWQGAYDSSYPYNKPAEKLGGETDFRSMLDGLHKLGYHVMLHTCVFGIDPYLPNIDELEKFARRDENGKLFGWQVNDAWIPGMKPFEFHTRRIPLEMHAGENKFTVSLGYVPGPCAVWLTVGGLRGAGRVLLHCRRQTVRSPQDWFVDRDIYDYIYPFQLACGEGEVTVELTGDFDADLTNAWIQVRRSMTSETPYAPWTYPILAGDAQSNAFVTLAAENIASLAGKYSADAVHLDAASFYVPFEQKNVFIAVREALPKSAAMGCEWFQTWEELDFHVLCQSVTQGLATKKLEKMLVQEANSLPMTEGIAEYYAWLDKTSPVCDFAADYILCYPHLCAADAFVPSRKVTNVYPPRKIPLRNEELWRTLKDAKRLRYIPALRVNYREHGLDEDTKEALKLFDRD